MSYAYPVPRSGLVPSRQGVADLLALAWFGRWMVLAAALLGLLAGSLFALVSPREFVATALLLPPAADEAMTRTELSILRGERVARGTVERVGAARIVAPFRRDGLLERLAPSCDAASHGLAVPCAMSLMRSHLRARVDGGAGGVLRLEAASPDSGMAVALVEAAISADQEARRAAYATNLAEALMPSLAASAAELVATLGEVARVREGAGVLDLGQSIAAAVVAASALAERDSQARERQVAVAAELADTRQALAAQPARVLDSVVTSTRDGGEDARAELLRLRLDRAHMAAHYKPSYPGLVELDGKIAAVEASLRGQPHSVDQTRSDIRNPDFVLLSAKATRLATEAEALAGQRAELARQGDAMTARAAALRAADVELSTLAQRQAVREATMRQIAAAVTDLRAKDSLAAARAEAMHLVQPPTAGAASRPGDASCAGAGAAIGLLLGLAAACWRRHRPVYVVAGDAERHLALPALARVATDRLTLVASPLPDLASRLLDQTDAAGTYVTRLHIAGTAEDDGSAPLAEALAAEFSARGARVLLLRLARDGGVRAESLGPNQQLLSLPAPDGAALAPLADPALRERHDMILAVSASGMAASLTRRLTGLVDLDLVVIRARRSRTQSVNALCATLAGAGRRPFGFVFTDEVSPFARGF